MTTRGESATAGQQVSVARSRQVENRLNPEETVEATTILDTRSLVLASVPTMLFTTIPLGVVLGGTVLALGLTGTEIGLLAVGLAMPVALLVGLSPLGFASLVAKYGHIEYAVTDQRFLRITDRVLNTDEHSLSLERARGVELNEGFLDRMLGTGDIRIEGASGETVIFENVPNSEEIYRLCHEKFGEKTTATEQATRS